MEDRTPEVESNVIPEVVEAPMNAIFIVNETSGEGVDCANAKNRRT